MDLSALLSQRSRLVFDGAWGTLLQSAGLEAGDTPERLNLTSPDKVAAVAKSYIDAGSDMIITNSFGGSRLKLANYGLDGQVRAINAAAARASRSAAGGTHMVFGSVGPTGRFLEPIGDISADTMIAVFVEQIESLVEGGVDGILVETMSDLGEAECAVTAAHRVFDGPVACTLTFDPVPVGFRTMMGVSPEQFVERLTDAGVDLIGANCGSCDLSQMTNLVSLLHSLTRLPIIVRPNAGIPRLVGGKTVFAEPPERFGAAAVRLVEAGAAVVGGCCGTTPDHIRAIKVAFDQAD